MDLGFTFFLVGGYSIFLPSINAQYLLCTFKTHKKACACIYCIYLTIWVIYLYAYHLCIIHHIPYIASLMRGPQCLFKPTTINAFQLRFYSCMRKCVHKYMCLSSRICVEKRYVRILTHLRPMICTTYAHYISICISYMIIYLYAYHICILHHISYIVSLLQCPQCLFKPTTINAFQLRFYSCMRKCVHKYICLSSRICA